MAPRGALATAVALGAIALANLAVGLRLPALLQDTAVSELLEVERRAARFPRAEVRALVIGNSHAIAGLRPPLVAAALGLGPDGAFSFALPASSPQEMRRLLEGQLAAFPRLALVLCAVDEYFLGHFHEVRARYLTAGDPAARAAWSAGLPAEQRLRLLAGAWLPLLDFGATLRAAFVNRPGYVLRGLVADQPPANIYVGRTAAIPYRWGFPPPWDQKSPRELRNYALRHRSAAAVARRAAALTEHAARVELGAAELGWLAGWLAGRGVRLVLVEAPYTTAMDAAIARRAPGLAARWRAALGDLPRVPAPALDEAAFYDADHLAPAGAEALAAHVARAVRAR